MADELKLRRQIAEGVDAADLLANELFSDTMKKIKDNCIQSWLKSQGGDEKFREHAWAMAKTVEALEDVLKASVNTGDAARLQLAADEADKETG